MDSTLHSAPIDRYKIVYIIFVWLGVGTVLPWNFFITQNSYLTNGYHDLGSKINVASMVPNVTMLILNAVFGHRFKTHPRLLVSLILVIILLAFTAVMAKVINNGWPSTVFLLTVILINLNAAIFQGGLAGVSGKFPSIYISAVFSGQAISAIFTSAVKISMLLLEIEVLWISPQTQAFFCFVLAAVFMGVSLVLYIIVSRTSFYRYYLAEKVTVHNIENNELNNSDILTFETSELVKNEQQSSSNSDQKNGPNSSQITAIITHKVNPFKIFRAITIYAISVFLIIVVTLSCIPAITGLIMSANARKYSEQYFILGSWCVLLVGNYVGCFIAEKLQWPKPGKFDADYNYSSTILLCLSTARIAFIPLFLYCSEFNSETAYIIIMLLYSFSNGYLCNSCMMSAPKICHKDDQMTASSLMVAALGVGGCVGVALSNVFITLAIG